MEGAGGEVVLVGREIIGGIAMVLAPIATTALPVAMRLVGQGLKLGATQAGTMAGGGLLGGLTRGSIIGMLIGAIGGSSVGDLIDNLVDMFGNEDEAKKTMAIMAAIEDAMGTGAIMVPEPPRGYSGEIYQQRLNYFHANMNDGKLWLSDFSNGKNSWR